MALLGETDTPGGVVPVPESAAVLDVPAAMTFRVPVGLPDATGANTTQALQWVPGAMMLFQVDVGKQSVRESANGADTAMLLTETPVVPVFVTQTSLSALVVPLSTEPKEMLVGDSENEPDDGGGSVIATETVADAVGADTLVAVTVAVVLALTVGAVVLALTVGAV